ncbi:DUF2784 domain-containing protein [Salininema proteolyticum]|uniref:DUF2784 domain-containing protein n=1 Tax=Salininema proteolyticum TaxID=1607685 RepID=A0ABV8TVM8_9ACTN
MADAVLADIVMAVHFAFVVYVPLGGFLAWKWPKTWFLHVPATIYALAIVTWDFTCPLTPLENHLRERAGQDPLEPAGFMATYIEGVVYPESAVPLIRVLTGLAIITSWVGGIVLHRRRALARA